MAIAFVKYTDLFNWSLDNILQGNVHYNPRYSLMPLHELLIADDELFSLDNGQWYQQVTVKSGGAGIEKRRRGYLQGAFIKTSPQHPLKAGQIVFSKIDARNGAFAVVPEELDGAIVTKDFPSYYVNSALVRAQYLQLLLTSSPFQEIIAHCSRGTTKRKRVDLDALMNQFVPVPTLEEQDVLLTQYNAIIGEGKAKIKEGADLLQKRNAYLNKSLGFDGISLADPVQSGTISLVPYSNLTSWNVETLFWGSFLEQTRYPLASISELQEDIQLLRRGVSPLYDKNASEVILNQKCVRWNYIDRKFAKAIDVQWSQTVFPEYRTRRGDILINSTGDGTIGRSAVVDEDNENMLFDTHVMLLRFHPQRMNPYFVSYFINSPIGQQQIERLKSAKTTKQTELGVVNFGKFRIPCPPVAEQNTFASQLLAYEERLTQLNRKDTWLVAAKEIFNKTIYAE